MDQAPCTTEAVLFKHAKCEKKEEREAVRAVGVLVVVVVVAVGHYIDALASTNHTDRLAAKQKHNNKG